MADDPFLTQMAAELGCTDHPQVIREAIREAISDLKDRANIGDRKRNERAANLGRALIDRLASLGITDLEIRRVQTRIDAIAGTLAETCGDIHLD